MTKAVFALVLAVTISGCSYSISEIDVSNLEPECVRECSANYSECVSQGNQVGFKTETLRACRDAYVVCTNTCQQK